MFQCWQVLFFLAEFTSPKVMCGEDVLLRPYFIGLRFALSEQCAYVTVRKLERRIRYWAGP
jgi:hypothetical protein